MSDSTTRSGVQLDLQRGPLRLFFTEREYDYNNPNDDGTPRVTGQESNAGVDQTPLDRDAAKVRTFDLAQTIAEALALPPTVTLGKIRVPLPDVITSAQVTYSKSSGSGSSDHPAANQAGIVNGSGGLAFDPRSSSQGSAAVSPTLTFVRDSPSSVLVNCENYFFYAESPMTMVATLAAINTVAPSAVVDLPILYPAEVQLLLKAGQVSARAGADVTVHASKSDAADVSSGDYAYGTDGSTEVGQQTQRDILPESLHDTITLSASDSQAVTVTANVTTGAVSLATASTSISFTGATANRSITATALASVLIPAVGTAVVPPTNPIDIPRTGRYLVLIEGEEDIIGLIKVHATVVNFLQYAH